LCFFQAWYDDCCGSTRLGRSCRRSLAKRAQLKSQNAGFQSVESPSLAYLKNGNEEISTSSSSADKRNVLIRSPAQQEELFKKYNHGNANEYSYPAVLEEYPNSQNLESATATFVVPANSLRALGDNEQVSTLPSLLMPLSTSFLLPIRITSFP
jgi:hypothetical protein